MSQPELQKPFAGFSDFNACLTHMQDRGYDQESARRICGRLQADHEGKAVPYMFKGLLHKISASPRIIAGYANMSMVDNEGDLITVDAWRRAQARFMGTGFENVNLVHGNITVGRVIPTFTDAQGQLWQTHVDENGWFVVCQIREDLMLADKAWQLIEQGRLRAFSISGNALPGKTQIVCEGGAGCHRQIDDLEVYEVTLCEAGINQGAVYAIIKSKECCENCKGRLQFKFTAATSNPELLKQEAAEYARALNQGHAETGVNNQKEKKKMSEQKEKKADGTDKAPPPPTDGQPAKETLLELNAKLDQVLQALGKLADAVTQLVGQGNAQQPGMHQSKDEQKGATPTTPPATSNENKGEKKTGTEGGSPPPETPPPETPEALEKRVQDIVKKAIEELAKPAEKRSQVPGAGNAGPEGLTITDAVAKARQNEGWDGVEALAAELRKGKGA